MTIRTKAATKEYRDGWDRVFGRAVPVTLVRKDGTRETFEARQGPSGLVFPDSMPAMGEGDALEYTLNMVFP